MCLTMHEHINSFLPPQRMQSFYWDILIFNCICPDCSGPVREWVCHRKPVKCVHVNPVDSNYIATASGDGWACMSSLSLLSLSSSLLSSSYSLLIFHSLFLLPSFPFSFLSPTSFLSLHLNILGEQTFSDSCIWYKPGIHTHTCTCSSAAIWDCRNVKGYNSCVQRVASSRTVTSAYFSPLSGQKLLTTSLDNHIW